MYIDALLMYLPALAYIERRARSADWIHNMFKYVITYCLFIELECRKRALFGWMGFVMQVRAMLLWRVTGLAVPMESRMRTVDGEAKQVAVLSDTCRIGCRLKNVELGLEWALDYEPVSVWSKAGGERTAPSEECRELMGELRDAEWPQIPHSQGGSFATAMAMIQQSPDASTITETSAQLLSDILLAQHLFREGRHWLINGFRSGVPTAMWGLELKQLNLKLVIRSLQQRSLPVDRRLSELGLSTRKHYPSRVLIDFSDLSQNRLDFLMDCRVVVKTGQKLLADFRARLGFESSL